MSDLNQENIEQLQHTAQRLHNFSLDEFKASTNKMIATSENSYKPAYSLGQARRVKEYTKEDIKEIIERGTPQAQQELSYNYFLVDGFYRRIIIYYATILKYMGLLIPNPQNDHKASESLIQKKYSKVLDFLDNINIESLCTNFMTRALIYGTYYGVIQTLDRENFAILDLPTGYCYSRFKDLKGNDIIEFDLHYFNSIQQGAEREKALKSYPKQFQRAYNAYTKGGPRYYKVPSDIGICFPLFDGRPFFLSMIPEIVSYREYEVLEREKDENEVKRVLVQQIPHLSDGTLLFEPVEAEEIHRGTVNMLKGNKNVSVLTTYADVEVNNTNSVGESVSKNNLEKIAQTVYRSAGVSSQLFAASGNIALNTSIQNDLAMVMSIANKFARFFTNIINRLYGNTTVNFKYQIMPISYYNEKEYIENAYKEATAGYSFLLPALAMGMTQKDLVNIKVIENDVLNLGDLLVPLKTSYTDSSSSDSDGGRPQTDDNQKTDKTITNIESGNE